MRICANCNKEFFHEGRGRPPKYCPKCRDNPAKKVAVANKNHRLRIFEDPVVSRLRVGQMLFLMPSLKDDIQRRRFAKEYKITRIEGGVVFVVRNEKTGYKQHEMPVIHMNNMKVGAGFEMVDFDEEQTTGEEEDE